MNDKFYALPKEKQSQILNAAYKVFATNQYKKGTNLRNCGRSRNFQVTFVSLFS